MFEITDFSFPISTKSYLNFAEVHLYILVFITDRNFDNKYLGVNGSVNLKKIASDLAWTYTDQTS